MKAVLEALGRPCTSETAATLIAPWDIDGNGRIDWSNGEFLTVVAAIEVTDVNTISEFVFAVAFRVFDQVKHVTLDNALRELFELSTTHMNYIAVAGH